MKHKVKKRDPIDWIFIILEFGVYLFMVMFLMVYIGKFGLDGFILKGGTTSDKLLNIVIWFTLVMYNLDKVVDIVNGGKHK